jgi:hypothetical protein
MTLPASVRVNAQFPFPSLVTGANGIAVSKSGGIWTIGPNFSALAQITSLPNPASKEIWVFDPNTGVYNVMTLAAFGASLLTDMSSTTLTIGTGTQAFIANPGKAWTIGSWVVASANASPANFMVGQVIGYSTVGGVTTLILNVTATGGAGTFSNWNLSLSSPPNPAPACLEWVFDGGGGALSAGLIGYLEVPFKCNVVRSTLAANVPGNAQADVWRVPPGSFPPSIANSIVAADPPILTGAQFSQDVTLAGWSTVLNPGDILAFVLTGVSGINQLTLSLGVIR